MSHPINARWQYYLVNVNRSSSLNKIITVIDSSKLPLFISKVCEERTIKDEEKILICILANSGLRISELLSLNEIDMHYQNGIYSFKIKVLKKLHDIRATPILRECDAPICLNAILERHLAALPPGSKLFSYTRQTAAHRLQSIFGGNITPHSFRHSFASYLYHSKADLIEAMDIMKISAATYPKYAHATNLQELNRKYKPA